jgi:hypothetical protein
MVATPSLPSFARAFGGAPLRVHGATGMNVWLLRRLR